MKQIVHDCFQCERYLVLSFYKKRVCLYFFFLCVVLQRKLGVENGVLKEPMCISYVSDFM